MIQEFEKRYGLMEGFDSLEAASSWCKVLQVFFRLRPFKEGSFKGNCPAEILGYEVKQLTNWLDYLMPPGHSVREHDNLENVAVA